MGSECLARKLITRRLNQKVMVFHSLCFWITCIEQMSNTSTYCDLESMSCYYVCPQYVSDCTSDLDNMCIMALLSVSGTFSLFNFYFSSTWALWVAITVNGRYHEKVYFTCKLGMAENGLPSARALYSTALGTHWSCIILHLELLPLFLGKLFVSYLWITRWVHDLPPQHLLNLILKKMPSDSWGRGGQR